MTLKRYIIEIFTIVPEIPSSPVDVGKDSKLTTPQGVTGFQEIVVKKNPAHPYSKIEHC